MARKSSAPKTSTHETLIRLPSDCRIGQVEDLHQQLQGGIASGDISLDGSAVDRVDTSVLQLLVVCQHELRQRGGGMHWTGMSTALQDAAGQLGLANTLAIPTPKPA